MSAVTYQITIEIRDGAEPAEVCDALGAIADSLCERLAAGWGVAPGIAYKWAREDVIEALKAMGAPVQRAPEIEKGSPS